MSAAHKALARSLAAASSVLAFAALTALPSLASADTTHVIGRGNTVDTIARRYHVTVKAIMDANHLKDTKHLKPGDTLVIPGAHGTTRGATTTPAQATLHNASHGRGDHEAARENVPAVAHQGETPNTIAPAAMSHGPSFEARPKQPDVIHAARGTEEFSIRVKDRRGKIPPPSLHQFQKMMASGAAQHDVDPRLVALVGMVSNHFGGRRLEIVSGFRPFSSTQYTAHSNHNEGRALDFRVQGVPNEALRDFCKGLRNVGVGYYPNSTFVHLDVRDAPAFWVDYSRPGEPPRYDKPNANADESSSDVPDELKTGTHANDANDAATPSLTDNPYGQ